MSEIKPSWPKIFLFYFFLIIFTLILLIIVLEVFAVIMVYYKGVYLDEINPDYYDRLADLDPAYYGDSQVAYSFHKSYGWLHIPGSKFFYRGFHYPRAEFRIPFQTNHLGFRSGRDYKGDDSAKIRIAIIGDSFVQALQVREEHSFPKVLESYFRKKGLDTFVYNFGISSTGTAHQYRIFEQEVLPIRPHLVVLAFFHNDLIDNCPAYSHEEVYLFPSYERYANGEIRVKDFDAYMSWPLVIHYDGSAAPLTLPKYLVPVIRSLSVLKKKMPLLFLKCAHAFLVDKYVAKTDYDPEFDVYRMEYPRVLQNAVKITFQLIRQIKEKCNKRNIGFMIVMIPSREQVIPGLWEQYLYQRRRILNPEWFDTGKPYRLLAEFLQREGIPYLDLSELFSKESNIDSFYYSYDMHFNRKGHDKAGQAIAAFIENELLQDESTFNHPPFLR